MTLSDLLRDPSFSPMNPPESFRRIDSTDPLLQLQAHDPAQHGGREQLFMVAARNITEQIASGLTYLHEMETPIAHRDVKPTNVLVGWDGTIKIVDFATAWSRSTSRGGATTHDPRLVCEVGTG
jgi:serine/threonine protein kinase